MIQIRHILLSLLVLFGALNPSVYADCCPKESPEISCCTLSKNKSKSNHGKKLVQEEIVKDCHSTNRFKPDGQKHFSCCLHQPTQILNDYANPTQGRIQLSGNTVESTQAIQNIILINNNFNQTWISQVSFGSYHSPPSWICFRNIRC